MGCFSEVNKDIIKGFKEKPKRAELLEGLHELAFVVFTLAFILGWIYGTVWVLVQFGADPEKFWTGISVAVSLVVMVFVMFYLWAVHDKCVEKRKKS